VGNAYAEAIRLRDVHQLYTVPVRVQGEGADKSVLPLGPWSLYLNGKDPEDAFVEIWDEHTDAPALALVCGSRFGVVALDSDTAEAEGYVLERKVPRTPTWRSTRGLHWLFRPGKDELMSGVLRPGLDLLAESKLALIPPTPGRLWTPSASVDDVPIAALPEWVRASAKVRRSRGSVTVQPGPDLPPGEAHERMVSMIGKLGRVLSADELLLTAARLNEGRLPRDELTKIVEHVLEKEGDAGRYFDKKEGFLPAILGAEIREAYNVRRGAGRHLYHYRDGVFAFDGRERVEQVVARVLGERFKPRHAAEVLEVLRAGPQEIPDEPDATFLNIRNGCWTGRRPTFARTRRTAYRSSSRRSPGTRTRPARRSTRSWPRSCPSTPNDSRARSSGTGCSPRLRSARRSCCSGLGATGSRRSWRCSGGSSDGATSPRSRCRPSARAGSPPPRSTASSPTSAAT
jgi:hypothetical protein